MDIPVIFHFLEQLAANNNREWFHANRDHCETARAEFEKLVTAIISRISTFDESIAGIQASECTYRMHRDLRFSQDKTPFKTHFGAYINAKGKKSQHCGYYVHLQPGNSMLAGGSISPPPKLLKALREAVYENIDEYRSIVEDPEFKKYFPSIGQTFVKTAPKGFPKDFAYMDYLKCKEFSCTCHVADDFFVSPTLLDNVEDIFSQLKRFGNFTNYTVDDFEYSEQQTY